MISPDRWRAGGDTFTWRGRSIFFRVAGAGAPLLLVHGFPTASWDWAPLWDRLAARRRLLALDMLGYGFSDKPRTRYTIAAQADLQEALLAREGVERYAILAHDYGDTVAQELLARQRAGTAAARIEKVCLLNGGLFPEAHRALLTQKLLASPLGPVVARLSSYRTFAASMRRIWGATPPAEEELRAMWSLVTAGGGLAVMPRLIGYLEERRRMRERWVGALVEAEVPLRFVDGLADPISGAHMAERYRALVPRPDVVELPGIGHYPQLEAPRAVGDAVEAFLDAA